MRPQRGTEALIGMFEKVARAMTRRHDIEVVASSCCSTDGRRIYFPVGADDFDGASMRRRNICLS